MLLEYNKDILVKFKMCSIGITSTDEREKLSKHNIHYTATFQIYQCTGSPQRVGSR